MLIGFLEAASTYEGVVRFSNHAWDTSEVAEVVEEVEKISTTVDRFDNVIDSGEDGF